MIAVGQGHQRRDVAVEPDLSNAAPFLAAAAAVFFGVNGMAPAAASEERPARAVQSVTVGYGDTLWDIAGRAEPDAARNETILRIGELNSLDGADLQPGQVLFVPTSG